MDLIEIFNEYNKYDKIVLKEIVKYSLHYEDRDLIMNKTKEVTEEELEKIERNLKQLEYKPLQYITNKQSFYKHDFYVDERCLIPQPDTEILIEKSIEILKKMAKDRPGETLKILDLATGSGAIAISIKSELDSLKIPSEVYASDISKAALEVAKINEKRILKTKINLIASNMFEDLKQFKNDKFDLVVSNPPYIRMTQKDTLEHDVLCEPDIALFGGTDGLDYYRIISAEIDHYLEGYLCLEIGYDQKEEVQKMFRNSKAYKDYGGNDRVIIYRNIEKDYLKEKPKEKKLTKQEEKRQEKLKKKEEKKQAKLQKKEEKEKAKEKAKQEKKKKKKGKI